MSKTACRSHPIHALIVAAGSGSRFGADRPKQYTQLLGKTILEHSVACVVAADVADVTLVVAPDDAYVQALDFGGAVHLCHGGAERFLSVQAGALAIRERGANDNDWVMIHDGARVLVPAADVEEICSWCHAQDAQADSDTVGAILATPVTDTLKRVENGSIAHTVSRDGLYAAQTPQVYRLGLLLQMLAIISEQGEPITDEAAGFERLGQTVAVLIGARQNIKLTYADDLPLIRHILAAQMDEL